jgi:hypothetical protein
MEKDLVLRGIVYVYLLMWSFVFYFIWPLKAIIVDYMKVDWTYVLETLTKLQKMYKPEIKYVYTLKNWVTSEQAQYMMKLDLIISRFKKLSKGGKKVYKLFENNLMIGPIGSVYQTGKQMAKKANNILQVDMMKGVYQTGQDLKDTIEDVQDNFKAVQEFGKVGDSHK